MSEQHAVELIVQAATSRPEPLTLHDITEVTGLTKGPALRWIDSLIAAGKLERVGKRPYTRYRLRTQVHISYHETPGGEHRPLAFVAEHHDTVDWRYPLTARIPDGPGRRMATKFLDQLAAAGMLQNQQHAADWPETGGLEITAPSISVIAFGSTVRGEARPGSDLDLLLIEHADGPKPPRHATHPTRATQYTEIALTASLDSERPIELFVVREGTQGQWSDALPPMLRATLAKEAITILSNRRPQPFWVETEPLGDG